MSAVVGMARSPAADRRWTTRGGNIPLVVLTAADRPRPGFGAGIDGRTAFAAGHGATRDPG
ncbi:hypothetical protein ACWDRB_49155 [Nonomuraea sp. NPDC003707]